jgi:hypothetical protein
VGRSVISLVDINRVDKCSVVVEQVCREAFYVPLHTVQHSGSDSVFVGLAFGNLGGDCDGFGQLGSLHRAQRIALDHCYLSTLSRVDDSLDQSRVYLGTRCTGSINSSLRPMLPIPVVEYFVDYRQLLRRHHDLPRCS